MKDNISHVQLKDTIPTSTTLRRFLLAQDTLYKDNLIRMIKQIMTWHQSYYFTVCENYDRYAS